MIIDVSQGTDPKNRIFYKDLPTSGRKVVELLNKQDAAYDFIGNEGNDFLVPAQISTRRKARIIAIDVQQAGRDQRDRAARRTISWRASTLVGDRFVPIT